MSAVPLSAISQEVACVPLSLLENTGEHTVHNYHLGKLLSCIVFKTKELSLSEGFIPINFVTIVRSSYTNLVIERDREDGSKRYYLPLLSSEKLPQIGYDYAMMIVKSALLEHYFTVPEDGQDIFRRNLPDFLPVGLYNPNPAEILPCAVFQCVFRDESVTVVEKFLNSGNRFVKIDAMQREMNREGILETLFNVQRKEIG